VKVIEAEHLLETYTLEDIMNYNDLTEADALVFLVEQEFISLPSIQPLDFE
jgi:hypothetical protein